MEIFNEYSSAFYTKRLNITDRQSINKYQCDSLLIGSLWPVKSLLSDILRIQCNHKVCLIRIAAYTVVAGTLKGNVMQPKSTNHFRLWLQSDSPFQILERVRNISVCLELETYLFVPLLHKPRAEDLKAKRSKERLGEWGGGAKTRDKNRLMMQ